MVGMAGYTKLFSSILASTVWREDDKTRIVWITLLAMADKDGVADGSIPGLADFARVSLADCEKALERLSSPDAYSRSKNDDGRRIAAVPGGWQIINHATYRAKMSADERRVYLREKQANYRARLRSVSDTSTGVSNVSDTLPVSTQAEADTEADTKAKARAPVCVLPTKTGRAHVGHTNEEKANETVGARPTDPSMDLWLRELYGRYPMRVTRGARTEHAFVDAMNSFDGGPFAAWDELLRVLHANSQSHEWRIKGMVPALEKYLRDGLWLNALPADPPVAEQLAPKTLRSMSAAAAIIKAETEAGR